MLTTRLLCQISLTVLACIADSLAAVWLVSWAAGFPMNASVVAVLSGALSSAAIAAELSQPPPPRI